MDAIVPDLIIHRVEEPEMVEIRTRWQNFDIRIRSTSPGRVKKMADEITTLFKTEEHAQNEFGQEAPDDPRTTKINLRPRGA